MARKVTQGVISLGQIKSDKWRSAWYRDNGWPGYKNRDRSEKSDELRGLPVKTQLQPRRPAIL